MKSRFASSIVVFGLIIVSFAILSWPSPPAQATPPQAPLPQAPLPQATSPRQLTIQLTAERGGTRSSYPHSFINFKGDSYFGVAEGPGGFWKTDGTEEGTVLVKQIQLAYDTFLGRRGDGLIVATADYIFFLASEPMPSGTFTNSDESERLSLWRSNGTTKGTIKLYEVDLFPYSFHSSAELIAFQELLYFRTENATYGTELWRSNGTIEGTTLVADINPGESGSFPSDLTVWNEKLYFEALTEGSGRNIWETDGSQAGTRLAIEIEGDLRQLVTTTETLYFTTWNQGPSGWSGGALLWQSDGTTAGTKMIESSYPAPIYPIPVSNKLLYQSERQPFSGDIRHWISDGTQDGTTELAASMRRNSSRRIATDGHAYFNSSGPNGTSVWRTDGTITETVKFTTSLRIPRYQNESVVDGENIYFTGNDNELWHSDGTVTGTTLITEIVPSSLDSRMTHAYPAPIHMTENGVLFGVNDGTLGKELWRSDGTPSGTTLVKDINTKGKGLGFDYLVVGDRHLYFANVPFGTSIDRYGLWKSDGTASGTKQFQELEFENSPYYSLNLATIGDVLYYAQYGVLRISDGSSAGTTTLFDSGIGGMVAYNDLLYFNRDGNLWRTDGTEPGTELIKQFQTDPTDNPNPPYHIQIGVHGFQILDGELYFRVFDDNRNVTLWVTDGTEAGTTAVLENLRSPGLIFTHQGMLYFSAVENGSTRSDELWRSDRTEAGTFSIKKFRPNGNYRSIPSGFTAITAPESLQGTANGTIVLFSVSQSRTGSVLWRTDGTEDGTVMVKDINLTRNSSAPLTSMGSYVFFSADEEENGIALWRSDGTEEGTVLVSDIMPGAEYSEISDLLRVGRFAYFVADDGVHGREIWRSDGTEGGTELVVDLNPGSSGSNPENLTYKEGMLYFSADNGTTGNQIHALTVEAPTSLDLMEEPAMAFESYLPFVNIGSKPTD